VRCAVTGSSGYIGRNVVETLLASDQVDRVDCIDVQPPVINHEKACAVRADIKDVALMTQLLTGVDFVFHLAAAANVDQIAKDPLSAIEHNVAGTGLLLEASRRANIGRFVLASSIWVYQGVAVEHLTEDTPLFPPGPSNLYVASKQTGEILCATYSKQFGLEHTILRYGFPYGPYMRPQLVIHRFLTLAMAGKTLTIAGTGEQGRDFMHVEDLARAHPLVFSRNAINRTYNLPGPRKVSVREIAEIVQRLVPQAKGIAYVDGRADDFRYTSVSCERAKEDFGWRPEIDIVDGIEMTYKWLLAHQSEPVLS